MDTSFQDDPTSADFVPTKVVVLSQLSIKSKESYYQLLTKNNAVFRKHVSSDGKVQYVADLRILAPNVKKTIKKKGVDLSNSVLLDERIKRLQEEGFVSVKFVGGVDDFDYNTYTRFAALIANNGDVVKPRKRPLQWIMKIIEDIYDFRYAYEKIDIDREGQGNNAITLSKGFPPGVDLNTIFPIFVIRRLSTVVGLKTIVDGICWDLLYNVHQYRKDFLEVEIFARFLQEVYTEDDLLFCLYVRSVVSSLLNISNKQRWIKLEGPARQPKPLWMSFRESSFVARTIFGPDNSETTRSFMALVVPMMVGQRTETADTRRIDVTQFLHLAVVSYHQAQGGSQAMLPITPVSQQLVSMPASPQVPQLAGMVVPSVPVPAPSQGIYMSKYAADHETAVDSQFDAENEEAAFQAAYQQQLEQQELAQQQRLLLQQQQQQRQRSSSSVMGGESQGDANAAVVGMVGADVDYGASFDSILAAMMQEKAHVELGPNSEAISVVTDPNFGDDYSAQGWSGGANANPTTATGTGAGAVLPALTVEHTDGNHALEAILRTGNNTPAGGGGENGSVFSGRILTPAIPSTPRNAWLDENGQWQEEVDVHAAAQLAEQQQQQQQQQRHQEAPAAYPTPRSVNSISGEIAAEGNITSKTNTREPKPQPQVAYEPEPQPAAASEPAAGNNGVEDGQQAALAVAEAGAEGAPEAAEGQFEDEDDEFANLQVGREQEFLQFICEVLQNIDLPPEYSSYIVNELARELRNHVNAELEGFEVTDIDSFDDKLLQILQEDDLRVALEDMRDQLMQQLAGQQQA